MTAAWHKRQDEKRVFEENAMQIVRPLLERAEQFKVWNWKHVPVAIAGTLFGALLSVLAYWGGSWEMFLLGSAFLLGAILVWMIVIPNLFRPLLTLTKDGLNTGAYGFIPWIAVDGIASVADRLLVRVPTLEKLTAQMHPCMRVLYRILPRRIKTQVILMMRNRERAALACKVAEILWETKTRRKNLYLPEDPELEKQMRRSNEHLARLEALRHTDDLAEHEKVIRELTVANADIDAERDKLLSRFLRMVFIVIAIFLLLMLFSIALRTLA
jgi:hypothetical protein